MSDTPRTDAAKAAYYSWCGYMKKLDNAGLRRLSETECRYLQE